MNDITVGAVGAAIIAGLVSILGLIIGKEQKISEFRQTWIDNLRKSIAAYLVNVNAISDALRLKSAGQTVDNTMLMTSYKSLNEASHHIVLCVNADEVPAKALLSAMSDFESIFKKNDQITPDRISEVEKKFINAARNLLKYEWKRVKKGETAFVWTKRLLFGLLLLMFIVFFYGLTAGRSVKDRFEIPHWTPASTFTR